MAVKDPHGERGVSDHQEFVDKGISGAKGREQRPAFDALWRGATRIEFDVVMVWTVDRLGRSISFLKSTRRKFTSSFISKASTPRHQPAGHSSE